MFELRNKVVNTPAGGREYKDLLMGKCKRAYVSDIDIGDYAVVVNAAKMVCMENRIKRINCYRRM